MQYHEIEPPKDLSAIVQCFWEFQISPEAPERTFAIVPDGCISITYCRIGHGAPSLLRVTGPRLTALEVPIFPGNVYWGVRLTPYLGSLSLDLSPLQLKEQLVNAIDVIPEFTEICFSQLENCSSPGEAAKAFWTALSRCVRNVHVDRSLLKGISTLFRMPGEGKICEVARSAGLSERQFQRRFRSTVGLTPKQFFRVRRLRGSIVSMRKEAPDWAGLAMEKGYTDQSHLIKECREMMHATPKSVKEELYKIKYGNFE